MAFTKLVLCVDTSGSMSGDKLKNAKELLSETVVDLKCDTSYYKFDTELHSITKNDFDTLSTSGGTRIENAINKLYDVELPKYRQYKTKLLFVTDAEDQISDPAACKLKKSNCEKQFSQGLYSDGLLTGGGGSGSCGDVLRDIFGSNQFYSCSDKQFKGHLGKISEATRVSNKVAGDIPKYEQKTDDAVKQNAIDGKKAQKDINDQKTKADTASKKANDVVNNTENHHQSLQPKLDQMADKKNVLTKQVDDATTDDQKDAVEDAIEEQLDNVKGERNKLNENEKQLDAAKENIQKEASNTATIANKFTSSTSALKKKVGAIVTNIADGCKELNTLEIGSKDQISKSKSSFTDMLNKLEEQVAMNVTLATEISDLRKKFRKTLKNLERNRIKNDEYKKQIKQHQDALNALLIML
eukprot:110545_1